MKIQRDTLGAFPGSNRVRLPSLGNLVGRLIDLALLKVKLLLFGKDIEALVDKIHGGVQIAELALICHTLIPHPVCAGLATSNREKFASFVIETVLGLQINTHEPNLLTAACSECARNN